MLVLTPSGTLRTITPGIPWHDRERVPACHFTGNETAEVLARFGYTVQPDPPVVPTPLPELREQALSRYRSEAAGNIAANVPAPWDALQRVATPEFAAWVDDYLGAVAGELARLEAAVALADEAGLAAIVADWPEVTA